MDWAARRSEDLCPLCNLWLKLPMTDEADTPPNKRKRRRPVYPPLPAFYHRPTSIDEMVADGVERVLSLLNIAGSAPRSWDGL